MAGSPDVIEILDSDDSGEEEGNEQLATVHFASLPAVQQPPQQNAPQLQQQAMDRDQQLHLQSMPQLHSLHLQRAQQQWTRGVSSIPRGAQQGQQQERHQAANTAGAALAPADDPAAAETARVKRQKTASSPQHTVRVKTEMDSEQRLPAPFAAATAAAVTRQVTSEQQRLCRVELPRLHAAALTDGAGSGPACRPQMMHGAGTYSTTVAAAAAALRAASSADTLAPGADEMDASTSAITPSAVPARSAAAQEVTQAAVSVSTAAAVTAAAGHDAEAALGSAAAAAAAAEVIDKRRFISHAEPGQQQQEQLKSGPQQRALGLPQPLAAGSVPEGPVQCFLDVLQEVVQPLRSAQPAAGRGSSAAPAIALEDEQFKAWPVDISSSSSGAAFDLVPTNLQSDSACAFMQELMQETQPSAKAIGQCRGRRGRGGKQAVLRNNRSARSAAAQAAAAAAAAPPAEVYDIWTDETTGWEPEDWCLLADGVGGQPRGEPTTVGSSAASAAAAAAGSSCGDDECDTNDREWYAYAAKQNLTFTWEDAPRGRFYTIREDDKHDGAVWLVPAMVITRKGFADELLKINRRTRVAEVTDPCHPCLHNPVRPAIVPPDKHYRLKAKRDLERDELLGLYWGRVMTTREDQAACAADLTCAYGQKHAYNMEVLWARGELIVIGDSSCRMCLINDARHWAADMEAQGWGPCPRAASGKCTCHKHAAKKVNVKWQHYVYRALNGDYVAAIAAFTSIPVVEGYELLTNYEEVANCGFWSTLQCNLQQHCFFNTLQQNQQRQTSRVEGLLQRLRRKPNSMSQAHVEQELASILAEAQEGEQQLAVLRAQAEAAAYNGPVPEAVAAARRATDQAGRLG